MPLRISTTDGGASHGNPFVGPIVSTAVVKVDVSDMSAYEVDANGYLKPGVPLKQDGNLVGSAAFVFGVTVEAVKIATGNTDAILDAITVDPFVTVATICQVSQDIIEDTLGRALTADELAGFDVAGSKVSLIRT
jgi:hypothetical protein